MTNATVTGGAAIQKLKMYGRVSATADIQHIRKQPFGDDRFHRR